MCLIGLVDVSRRVSQCGSDSRFQSFLWIPLNHCFLVMFFFLKYLSFPNSNFPGPFLRKLPLIQVGTVPLMVVGIGSGVSSTERTSGAMLSSPLACGHRCLLDTENGRGEVFLSLTVKSVKYLDTIMIRSRPLGLTPSPTLCLSQINHWKLWNSEQVWMRK